MRDRRSAILRLRLGSLSFHLGCAMIRAAIRSTEAHRGTNGEI